MSDWLEGRPLTEQVFLTEWLRAHHDGSGDAPTIDRPQIVAFRCEPRGHLLGAIYLVPDGKLFMSAGLDVSPAARRAVVEGKASAPRRLRKLPRKPEARMPEVDELGSERPVAISCRCGEWPALSQGQLLAALRLPRPKVGPVVISVSRSGPVLEVV